MLDSKPGQDRFTETVEFLRGIDPFKSLGEPVLQGIAAELSTETYPAGTAILRQDGAPSGHLRIIRQGEVRVSLTLEGGEEFVIDYRSGGDTFGLWSILEGSQQKTNVTALTETNCLLVPRDTVLRLLATHASFTEFFLKSHLSMYLGQTYQEMAARTAFNTGTDRILFTARVGDVATGRVTSIAPDVPIRDAARMMTESRISSLIVMGDDGKALGIVTDRDLRVKVVAGGADPAGPVRGIMSSPIISVDASDHCFEAVLRMLRYNIHHIVAVRGGRPIGVMTNHDLMVLLGGSPLSLAREIENRSTIEEISSVSRDMQRVVRPLLKEGAKASNITGILSEMNDRIVRKVVEIVETRLGKPPVPYSFIVYGSEGRKEQTFRTDQDNAIVYADPKSPAEAKKAESYFRNLGIGIRDGLVACGFPPCKADYMGSNPKWCRPLSDWRKYFRDWISTPSPESILKSLIFFDFRYAAGEPAVAATLRRDLIGMLEDQNIFLARMASVIMANRPPIGFFGGFLLERSGEHKDELDLKLRGTGPIVDAARLMSLSRGVSETSTLERFRALRVVQHPVMADMGEELEQAFEFISLIRIQNQVDRIERGLSPENFLNPENLSGIEKRNLKESFRAILKTQDLITEMYKAGMVGS